MYWIRCHCSPSLNQLLALFAVATQRHYEGDTNTSKLILKKWSRYISESFPFAHYKIKICDVAWMDEMILGGTSRLLRGISGLDRSWSRRRDVINERRQLGLLFLQIVVRRNSVCYFFNKVLYYVASSHFSSCFRLVRHISYNTYSQLIFCV